MIPQDNPLIDFKNLQENGIYSIEKIELLLLEYGDYYKDLKSYWVCSNKECLLKYGGFCFCKHKTDEDIFLKLYEELDELSQYHRKENYFKQELDTYFKVKDDPIELKKLIVRNEFIGADECFMFLIEYHDYCAHPIHLKILTNKLLGYEVFVDRDDFKSTIEFLDIFNTLFWEKEIYPESEILVRIKKELKESEPPEGKVDF